MQNEVPPLNPLLIEAVAEAIREEWVFRASQEQHPKPSHLIPWVQLDEHNKQLDRYIAEASIRRVMKMVPETQVPIERFFRLSEEM